MEYLKNSYKVEDKKLVSLSVYNVGYQRCEPLVGWGPGNRDHYLIHYVVRGCGYYSVGGRTFTLRAGDVFLIYPDTGVTYYADGKDPWEYYWVGFSGTDAPAMLDATRFTREMPVIHGLAPDDPLKDSISRIYSVRGNTYADAVRMTGELYLTLYEFIREASDSAAGMRTGDFASVQKAIDYIAMNYSYPLSVDSVADYVGISRSMLFREFKKYFKISPKEYITDFRMRKARMMLSQGDCSVTQVAYSVGYDNPMYFSKAFAKAVGMPPSTYAMQQREKETQGLNN